MWMLSACEPRRPDEGGETAAGLWRQTRERMGQLIELCLSVEYC